MQEIVSSSNATVAIPGASPLAMLATMTATFLVIVELARARRRSKTVLSTKSKSAADARGPLPPGPTGLPVVGNMHQMLANKPVFRWLHHLLKEAGGEIVRVRLGRVHIVAVSCPEMAREVLRKNDAVFADRPTTFAAESFSVGYRSASISPFGDQWKKMRRVLTAEAEVLSPATEHRLRGAREEEADHILRYVHVQCTGNRHSPAVVDVRHVARHFCGNVIRRVTLGRRHFGKSLAAADTCGPGSEEEEHVQALFTTLNYLDAFCVSNYFSSLVGTDLDGHEKVIRGVMRTLNRLHDPIIEAH